ncbi:DUF501 domain-containing protein [Leucobacter chromiiresistens]|uniref:Septum formation initiator family protein n=1 Tax=Leucobacter chromiiresistens TaxID=1079994 RepID=A0A147EBS1_9MICO|nr:DUF501 domain-containing protein [Leucobacter chromiiresistens]KTR81762.1 septum formation initiator family protein [Leucobacter chromiiresistens]SDQ52735.1 hypothetical protein SAMN04488565_2898 [Leucobacter chromiiresistens]
MTRPPYPAPTEADIAAVSEQLGREARGVIGIAARAADGSPAVVATAPRLPDGSPFPTFYYLCHPEAVAAASRLEAAGVMNEFNELLASDETVREQYRRAHEQFIADRDSVGEVPEVAGVSSGGMPTRVKCLHALMGHALAAGPGVNPIGDLALERSGWRG